MKTKMIESIEGPLSFDEALKKSIEEVDNPNNQGSIYNQRIIFDGQTGKVVAQVGPNIRRSGVGYNSTFASAWDRMLQRRAEREAKGQTTTDD